MVTFSAICAPKFQKFGQDSRKVPPSFSPEPWSIWSIWSWSILELASLYSAILKKPASFYHYPVGLLLCIQEKSQDFLQEVKLQTAVANRLPCKQFTRVNRQLRPIQSIRKSLKFQAANNQCTALVAATLATSWVSTVLGGTNIHFEHFEGSMSD